MDAVNEPKISIILTIYKVEPYLRKCLDSIAVQTHKNLEVVMVDNGSPDNCPAICDEYAANDPRFKVVHIKENHGNVAGYNAGLDAATGDWIGFVDPDDWVEPDMFEYLLAGAQRHGVKMAVCGFYRTDGQREKAHAFEQECVLSGRQAIETVLNGGTPLCTVAWQSLCARELWDGVRFQRIDNGPADLLSGFAMLRKVEALVCLPGVKYYNLQRPGHNSSNRSLRYMLAHYRTWEELHNGLFAGEPEFQTRIINKTVLAAWWVWSACYTASREECEAAKPQIQEISAFCRPHIGKAVRDPDIGPIGRIGCRLVAWPAWWAFALAYVLRKISDWKHRAAL